MTRTQQNRALIWQAKDRMYAYDGKLGAEINEDRSVEFNLWSPSADHVNIILYDKHDQTEIAGIISMERGDSGVWHALVQPYDIEYIHDYENYFYHYEIERDGEKVLALDPYAKSMAAWDYSLDESTIGKAAIVDPSSIGVEDDFAHIEGYQQATDAIIYEAHVRDFSSDIHISSQLKSEFGTFASFIEKLDYIQDLGVTHIQLLPVLSYYNINESLAHRRDLEYKSSWANYNWGYDPHHYFALSGAYCENPKRPDSRIAEFKRLVHEIHQRGMGVILDVVYNHTASVHILEDLEPEYYHFMNKDQTSRTSFGGGRLGSTHYMTRRLIIDSLKFLAEEYKVDGFRFDMMGDLDAQTIQMAHDELKMINPNTILIGEGWLTYCGDEEDRDIQAADQCWMNDSDAVGSFSDDYRNELKSGYTMEGEPRFLTNGARSIETIFANIKAQPTNYYAPSPKNVVQYVEAHDNLTLHDVIAYAIKKDPSEHVEEIHRRIRLGNLMLMTSQGIAFIHSGQEYGRTKQLLGSTYEFPAPKWEDDPDNAVYMVDSAGYPFKYPYFVHDSYNSSDAVNRFDWMCATDEQRYPIHVHTREYTQGLIQLRRSSDAFHLKDRATIDEHVHLIESSEINAYDVMIAYQIKGTAGDEYVVVINADEVERTLTMPMELTDYELIVDGSQAGVEPIVDSQSVVINNNQVTIQPLTGLVWRKK